MNLNYMKETATKASAGLVFSLILMLVPLSSMAGEHKQSISKNTIASSIDVLVKDVLKNTEQSLALVESDASNSLQYVENAIASLREIKSQLSRDTHIEAKSPLIVAGSKEYWFKYPQVNAELLNDKDSLPTLHSKFKSGALYNGEEVNQSKNQVAAYFDYAFAYASLKMARESLMVNNEREAKSTLTWVFTAVYLNPDFFVAEYENNQMIDKLINMQGEYPYLSFENSNFNQQFGN
ncbi:MAG: hypothetical protein ACRBDX_00010 [Gammaproteobacteria bacterium]